MSWQDVQEFYVEQDDPEPVTTCPHCGGFQTWIDWRGENDALCVNVNCGKLYKVEENTRQ